ncbi:MraY family glycosyltransferase [Compostibacter hankyongensis]|uniref:MraY family glycosyltransferase n=1 Tax=Compostibacter hankyongensis TaxID=1007089 RepID=A0ABP8FV34_9BACT
MNLNVPLLQYLLIVGLAYTVVTLSTPVVIFVSFRKRLFDEPDEFRKLHTARTPNLGGVAMFCAWAFCMELFDTGRQWASWNYVFASGLILFATGLKDDLIGMVPLKKFGAQLAAAFIIVYYTNVRLTDLHGLFGIHALPYGVSMVLSMTGIIFLTNAYNLIDGIDGLAGGLALLAFCFFGAYFASRDKTGAAYMSFAMVGAVLGFLRYNISPSKIFMGDTGSLLIGFLVAVLAIRFAENGKLQMPDVPGMTNNLVLMVSIIILPVFDTLRVFINRIAHGRSPFKADRQHIHHLLLDLGLSHTRASMTLLAINVLFIAIAFIMTGQNPTWGILVLFLMAGLTVLGLKYLLSYKHRKEREKMAALFYKDNNTAQDLTGPFALSEALSVKVGPQENL